MTLGSLHPESMICGHLDLLRITMLLSINQSMPSRLNRSGSVEALALELVSAVPDAGDARGGQ